MLRKVSYLLAVVAVYGCGREVSLSDLYLEAIQQMNGLEYVTEEFSGHNVRVGILDAGFFVFDSLAGLHHIMAENRLLFTKDYINEKNNEDFFQVPIEMTMGLSSLS